jgi:DNA repair exonuclease SbcCD ATPase subunit
MRVKLQIVLCSEDGHEESVTDIVTLKKDSQRIEQLGLTLKEAKQLLNTIQRRLLHHQVEAFLDRCSTCPDCGTPLKAKG